MAWITPKTNWVPTDYFDLDPDYNRIKGNIEYLFEFSKKLYVPPDMIPMQVYDISDDAEPDFFNNIVDNVLILAEETYYPPGFETMERYEGNKRIWTANHLNTIEKNLNLVYTGYKSQWNLLPMLAYEMGGSEF